MGSIISFFFSQWLVDGVLLFLDDGRPGVPAIVQRGPCLVRRRQKLETRLHLSLPFCFRPFPPSFQSSFSAVRTYIHTYHGCVSGVLSLQVTRDGTPLLVIVPSPCVLALFAVHVLFLFVFLPSRRFLIACCVTTGYLLGYVAIRTTGNTVCQK